MTRCSHNRCSLANISCRIVPLNRHVETTHRRVRLESRRRLLESRNDRSPPQPLNMSLMPGARECHTTSQHVTHLLPLQRRESQSPQVDVTEPFDIPMTKHDASLGV